MDTVPADSAVKSIKLQSRRAMKFTKTQQRLAVLVEMVSRGGVLRRKTHTGWLLLRRVRAHPDDPETTHTVATAVPHEIAGELLAGEMIRKSGKSAFYRHTRAAVEHLRVAGNEAVRRKGGQ